MLFNRWIRILFGETIPEVWRNNCVVLICEDKEDVLVYINYRELSTHDIMKFFKKLIHNNTKYEIFVSKLV